MTHILGTSCGNLRKVRWVDGVVDRATGYLLLDLTVHGSEASRGTLKLTSASCADDDCGRLEMVS